LESVNSEKLKFEEKDFVKLIANQETLIQKLRDRLSDEQQCNLQYQQKIKFLKQEIKLNKKEIYALKKHLKIDNAEVTK
jgi:hypothetical protein